MHSRHPIIGPMRCLLEFAQTVEIKRALQKIATDPPQTFWYFLMGALTDHATMNWTKVFGSYSEPSHWTNVIPKARHGEIRSEISTAIGLKWSEWRKYHKWLCAYRNEIVAHHDPAAEVAKYPQFDVALRAAYFMYAKLFELVDGEQRGGLPHELQTWSRTVIGNMEPIIRLAFAGSKVLGPNIKPRPNREP